MESEVHLHPAPAVPEATRDEPAIKEVINRVKSQGLFDQFRKECIADVDTKPAYHNLIQRVESYVEHFLQGQKWSLGVNKNQLRETLRRQLHNSGMMQNGVERIIEQVVNPKILLGIKPKIDEAVCDHLGIDLKARQEEQQRRKQEQQKLLLQQMQQQQQIQTLQNQNVKNGEPVFPTTGSAPLTGPNPWVNSGMASFPSPSVPGGPTPIAGVPGVNPPTMGGNFPGMMPPFSLMPGWMPGFNTGGGIPPMMPGQPMIPAYPGAPPGVVSPAAGMGPHQPFISSSASAVTSSTGGSIVTSPPPGHSVTSSTLVAPGQHPVPNLSHPPPGMPIPRTPSSASNTTRIGASPVISSLVPPGTSPLAPPGTSPIAPPGTSPLAPPGTTPPPGSSRVLPAVPPPPGTVPIPESVPVSLPGKSNPVPVTPHIPALLSHTLAKVSEDELTPEKLAVFKTAAAFITKTVNNAGGAAGGDLASIFSPRVLAEAMMEDCGKPLTKSEMRAAKRKERIKEMERLKNERDEKEAAENQDKVLNEGDEDKENPIPPPKHNLMDVFQGAEDVSDDEEALDMLMDVEESGQEPEDRHKQGIILSDEDGDKPPTSQPGKRYNFAWDVDLNSDEMSDVTVSSVHTSDMSSFEDEEEEDDMFSDILSEEEKPNETSLEKSDEEESAKAPDEEEASSMKAEDLGHVPDNVEEPKLDEKVEKDSEVETIVVEEIPTDVEEGVVDEGETVMDDSKENVSDVPEIGVTAEPVQVISDTMKTPVEESPSKPRKLLALSYHYSDSDDEETREERKARIAKEKEERYLKRQQRRAELDAKKKERDEEKARLKREKQLQKEKMPGEGEDNKPSFAADTPPTGTPTATNVSIEAESSSQTTPRKRKNKAEMKEHLLQQKVMEKKAALRRKRTRNRRYASDEFTSIFSDHKKLNQSYTDGVNQDNIVTFEGDAALEVVEMTVVDQECIVETVGEEIETSNAEASEGGKDLVLQCPSPYSDISDRSMSERSEPENVSEEEDHGVDQVSSDDELGDLEEVKIVEEMEDSGSKGPASPAQSASESDVGQVSSETALTPDTSRMSSARSKSNMSQDEMGSVVSSQSMDKRKTGTSFSQEEDIESQTSHLESSIKSPLKCMSDMGEDDVKSSKTDDVATAATNSPASKDIMGELELEPVSDEDSLGGLDDEEEEETKISSDGEKQEEREDKDPEKERHSFTPPSSHNNEPKQVVDVRKRSKSTEENASDEGEIKSESEKDEEKVVVDEEELEEKRRRAANRKPINQVDFGEAEKRARVARGIYSGSGEPTQDWRTRNVTMGNNPTVPNYRGGFNTWTSGGSSSIPQYGPGKNSSRYMAREPMSPVRAKSPGTFDAESETSSHSRSSVRVRDDVPPPYPIEGVNVARKHRSPASSSDNAVDYKPLSPPSPVSSTSSRMSSRSRSRSMSSQSSRSSSYSSATSPSSRRKLSKRLRQKKRRRERQRRSTTFSPHHSPPPRPSSVERRMSPRNSPDPCGPSPFQPVRDTRLSSGNESISSDELPNFSDDEAEVSVKQKIKRSGSGSFSSGSCSSLGLSKRPKKDSPGSISSSELIYSPTRPNPVSGGKSRDSDSSSSSAKRAKKRKRRRSSSLKSSSSDLPPVSPLRRPGSSFSPHRPSSPIIYPPLPDDMSGFQPPLPQELMPTDLPPLPPQPPSPPPIPISRPSISEEEEGECLSSPDPDQPPSSEDAGSKCNRGPSPIPTHHTTHSDNILDLKSNNVGDSKVNTEISSSVLEEMNALDTNVSFGNKEDCDNLNSDENENFPPSADVSPITQDHSSLSADPSCIRPDNSSLSGELPSHTQTLSSETSSSVVGDKLQLSETEAVERERSMTQDIQESSCSPQRPPSPPPLLSSSISSPPLSPSKAPPSAALSDSNGNITTKELEDNSPPGASDQDVCSSESASNSKPTEFQSDEHVRTSGSSQNQATPMEESVVGDATTDPNHLKDNANPSNNTAAGSSPHDEAEEAEQSEDISPITSRKRSAQENDNDSDQESSSKKQKTSEN